MNTINTTIKLANGVEITVPNAWEAAAFLREAGLLPAKEAPPVQTQSKEPQPEPQLAIESVRSRTPLGAPARKKTNGHAAIDESAIRLAISFLELVKAHPSGVSYPKVMEVVGVSNPKAIGNRATTINKEIESLGFERNAVYLNPKTANGRIWKPARKIGEAISALQEQIGR